LELSPLEEYLAVENLGQLQLSSLKAEMVAPLGESMRPLELSPLEELVASSLRLALLLLEELVTPSMMLEELVTPSMRPSGLSPLEEHLVAPLWKGVGA
jgi:hypothetical protein